MSVSGQYKCLLGGEAMGKAHSSAATSGSPNGSKQQSSKSVRTRTGSTTESSQSAARGRHSEQLSDHYDWSPLCLLLHESEDLMLSLSEARFPPLN